MTDFVETAKDAVRIYADEMRRAFLAPKRVKNKADDTILTETDLGAERAMRALIAERYSDHAILGEEYGETGSGRYRWVIDPLDGTRNFAYGIPLFVSAAALLERDEVIAAAIYHPMLDELLWAEKGNGAFRNGDQLILTGGQTLKAALINFDRSRSRLQHFGEMFRDMSGTVGSPRVLGSASYTMGRVAVGSIDAMVMLSSNLWDIAPGFLIASEAGAVGVDFSGNAWNLRSAELILAHPDLARQLVAAIGPHRHDYTVTV